MIKEKASEYIDNNYMNPSLTLSDVAVQVRLSSNYFSEIFKKEIGTTFINYLTGIRINAACELLSGTNMKIVKIAESVGYYNPTYFSTVFKRSTTFSPQEYRNRSRLP